MNEVKVRAGFVGFGEVNTPREFIVGRCATAAAELRKRGVELVETAPVCDDPAGENAERAIRERMSLQSNEPGKMLMPSALMAAMSNAIPARMSGDVMRPARRRIPLS